MDFGGGVGVRTRTDESSASARPTANPPIAPWLRLFTAAETLVLLWGGALLFIAIGLAQPLWPWELTPFNARFLGGYYLGGMVAAALMVALGTWAPARVVVKMIFVFTTIVLVASLFHPAAFIFERWATWVWFALYLVIAAETGAAVWLNRGRPPADPVTVPTAWRAVQVTEAVIMGAYGVAILVAPVAASAFWPWPVDAFHGQVYSAMFISPAVSAWLMSRRAAPIEYVTIGFAHLVAGLLIIVGVVVTDASANSVDWGAGGTWVWVAGFALLAGVGAAMIAFGVAARSDRSRTPAQARHTSASREGPRG